MIRNKSNLEIFDSFIEKYGNNNYCQDKDIVLISFEQPPYCGVNKNDSPYEACFNRIACSMDICAALGFSKEEMYALIAHEIGHIHYETRSMDCEILDKEIKADSMAKQFGLGDELASALQKMIDSGKYEDVKEDMQQRIVHLSQSRL